MQIECKSCGSTIPAENVNIEQLVAKCAACNAVFGFRAPGHAAPARQRPQVAMPKGLSVEHQGGELVFTVVWRRLVLVLFLTVFVLAWNAIIWPFFAAALEDGPAFLAVFLSIFVFAGALVAYAWLCVFFNSTEVRVGRSMLSVRHGPLPVPGGCELRADQIEQLYVQQHLSTSTRNGRSQATVSYPLFARMKDGTRKAVLRNVPDSDTALYFEQQIEQHLGIEDREMPGEI